MRVHLLSLVLVMLLWPSVAAGATEVSTRFTLADAGLQNITVRTVFDQISVHFDLPYGRVTQEASLRLHLAHGRKLLPEHSELTVVLNGERVARLALSQDNAAENIIQLPIPKQAPRAGDNLLLFQFKLRTRQTGCDFDDPNLWARVYADTALELHQLEGPVAPDLSLYPAWFATADVSTREHTTLVLPDRPTRGELTAAARIAAALGREAGWTYPPLKALAASDLPKAEAAHLIVVDTARRNPLAAGAPEGLSVGISPSNPDRLALVVSGSDEFSLARSVALLTARPALTTLGGTHAQSSALTSNAPAKRPSLATFADLDRPDERVRGIGGHDLYYSLDVPYTWKITNDASIRLNFTHAPRLTNSELKVSVNGVMLTEVPLTNRNATDGRVIVQLSPRQLHVGRNWLHLSTQLQLPRQDCAQRYLEEAWMQILSSSTVYLAHVEGEPPLDLHYWPSSLATATDLGGDAFVLPAFASAADLTAMVRLAAKLGTYAEGEDLRLEAMSAAEFEAAALPDKHVIAIGSPETNALLARYDALLPQPLTRVSGGIKPAGGRDLLPGEADGGAGYVELLPAPWSGRSMLMVVSPSRAGGLAEVVDALPVKRRPWTLRGNVAVISAGKATGLGLGGLARTVLSGATRARFAVAIAGTAVALGGLGLVLAQLGLLRTVSRPRPRDAADDLEEM